MLRASRNYTERQILIEERKKKERRKERKKEIEKEKESLIDNDSLSKKA